MNDWRVYGIEEIGELKNSRRIPLSSTQRSARKGPYPYYGASGIVDYIDDYLFEGEHVLISEDGENLKTRKTPVAFIADGEFWVNNHAHVVKCHTPALTKLLVYYFSDLDLNEFVTGAVQPKLNKSALCSIPLVLPSNADEQDAIASVLGSLDDKIDLLHRQNKTLEAMAETLFRQWFVEEVSEGWEEVPLSLIVEHLKSGITPANQPLEVFHHFSLPAFDNGRTSNIEFGSQILSNKFVVESGTILISKLNPRFPRIWAVRHSPENAICSTEFQVLKPSDARLMAYVYFLLSSPQARDQLSMAASGTSGSHQRVRPEDILSIACVYPNQEYAIRFSEIADGFMDKMDSNIIQIRTLEKLRDTLLPKLMSGEVRVQYE